MEKEKKVNKSGAGKTVAAIVGGAAIGAGLGVLFAPKSGKETRNDLKKKLDELVSKIQDIKVEDVKKYVTKKTKEIEKALNDLDKEKLLKEAEKKAKKIEKSAKELVEYVKDKGETALESTADAVHQKAIEVTKSVLKKLEEK
ncbi:MAG TPA: gas vesicle protein [Firmicutes bacterium]|nr:gas vesicle protein [Bacillota bacterium]